MLSIVIAVFRGSAGIISAKSEGVSVFNKKSKAAGEHTSHNIGRQCQICGPRVLQSSLDDSVNLISRLARLGLLVRLGQVGLCYSQIFVHIGVGIKSPIS